MLHHFAQFRGKNYCNFHRLFCCFKNYQRIIIPNTLTQFFCF
nr:MAG TPA: hypothetical protein [Caudoviricetes sp.]